MHNKDVDKQTGELSYPKELKILDIMESKRDAK